MTLRTGAAHVEQPRRGAAAAAGRHRRARCSTRRRMGVGDVPSVPSLALGSGEVTLQSMTAAYAAFANHGLRAEADPHPPRRGPRRPRAVTSAQDRRPRAISDTTAFLMSTMLADVINAGTGGARAQLGLHAAGGRQDRHDQRLQRRLVRRLHAEAGRPASGSASISRGRFCRTALPPKSPCRCGRTFMKSRDRRRQARVVTPPAGVTTARVCRLSGKLATEGCQDVDVVNDDGERRAPLDGLHRIFRARHRADRVLRSASSATESSRASPALGRRNGAAPSPQLRQWASKPRAPVYRASPRPQPALQRVERCRRRPRRGSAGSGAASSDWPRGAQKSE